MNQLILREARSSYCFTEHTSLCLGLPASDLSVFGDCGENQIRGQCEIFESWKSAHRVGGDDGSELVSPGWCHCEGDSSLVMVTGTVTMTITAALSCEQ